MDIVAAALRVTGTYSPRLAHTMDWRLGLRHGDFSYRLVDGLVKRRDLVVDIGANGGVFANRLATLVGREGHVHAFEPNPVYVKGLRRLQGRRRNITVHACALSDAPGEDELFIPRRDGRPVRELGTVSPLAADAEHDTISVSRCTLDGALEADARPVAFIKCDVEGHEHAVLRGASRTLARSHPTLLIEIEQRHRQDDIAKTFGLLRDLGYVGYAIRADALEPLEGFDVQRDQLALLPDDSVAWEAPAGYVNDFLFVLAGDETVFRPVPRKRGLGRIVAGNREARLD